MAFSAWDLIDAILSSGEARRTLLFGPPGTGKTYAATRLGLPEKKKVYSITMTEETPAAEIRGHFLPKEKEFVWMDGPAIRAWREGSRLVINEIDRASGDCMSLLNAILDDPDFAELTLPTGETVRPHAGFQVVATMNGEPGDLEASLRDRFPVTIEVNDVNPEALSTLDPDLQEAARNTALIADPERRVSVRAWLEFGNLRTKLAKSRGKDEALQIAAGAVFGKNSAEALKALKISSMKK